MPPPADTPALPSASAYRGEAPNVIVIGAGVIGITAALRLQDRGLRVTVIDREGICAGASFGNAGAFAFSDIEPLAAPGIIRKAPFWLLDPLGPLAVPPAYAPQIAPWLFRFWRASRRDRFAAGTEAQNRMMALARTALERLIADTDAGALIQRDGALEVYESAAEFRRSRPVWEGRQARGIRFTPLESHRAIAAHQPGLSPRFTHGVFLPDWINTADPARWVDHLAQIFLARGGAIERGEISALEAVPDGVRLQMADAAREAPQVVIAAGAWSHRLAATLGERIPLETERGYNTTLPPGAFDLRLHVTFPGHGFVVSRINGGVRVGGAVELGGLVRPPNYRRSEALLKKAEGFLPGLRTEGGQQWMGFRPSLPDSLPVISRAARSGRVVYAFGHGHLGLTQSAATAEIVADLVTRRTPAIPMDAFAASRFTGLPAAGPEGSAAET